MSSRDHILNAISRNRPAQVMAPVISVADSHAGKDLSTIFAGTLQFIGGKIKQIHHMDELKKDLEAELLKNAFVVNTISEIGPCTTQITADSTAIELEKIDITYLRAQLGVAENGSVWIDDSNLPNRLIPFICQHLVIVLEAKQIVPNMHVAYSKINTFGTGYGLFLAGPSKTADIEQSLVIGAHGARSLTVYLLEN